MFIPNPEEVTKWQYERIINEDNVDRIAEIIGAYGYSDDGLEILEYQYAVKLLIEDLAQQPIDMEPDDINLPFFLKFYNISWSEYEHTPIKLIFEQARVLERIMSIEMLNIAAATNPTEESVRNLQRKSMTPRQRDIAMYNAILGFGGARST